MEKRKKIAWIVGLGAAGAVIVLAVALTVAFLLPASKPSEITVAGSTVRIAGAFGAEIELRGAEVMYLENGVTLLKKVNGSAMANALKGEFTAETYAGTVYVNLSAYPAPCVRIAVDGRYYFLNRKDRDSTLRLYEQIAAANV